MKVEIKDYDDNVIQTFEGSIEEASKGFINYIRDRKFKPGEIFPWFTEGTSISDAEAFFDKTTYSVVKEDLLPYIEYGYFTGLYIEGDFDDAVNIFSEDSNRFSMKIIKAKDGSYEIDKPFTKRKQTVTKSEGKQDPKITMVYDSDSVSLNADGKLTGGRPRVLTKEEKKMVDAAYKVFFVDGLNKSSF